ncbi:MAG: hypothetical protein IT281_02385 [Ignavibacteria bacterium]|nr:hypothetical protein [Ignavibacteria bacterium]
MTLFLLDLMTKYINYAQYPVPRIRHHAKPVLYFPLKQHRGDRFNYPAEIESLDWKNIFAGGKPPAYIDIGCGLGRFLINMALFEPKKNILGFEVRQGAVEWIEKVIAGEKIPNARALWYSAVNGFKFIKSGSIEKAFYFFPDPWVKRRHYKRRAFSAELLDEIHRVLKPSGKLYLMTDVPEVDGFQQEVMTAHGGFNYKYVSDDKWDLPIETNQEEFCIRKKIPFIRMACRKK